MMRYLSMIGALGLLCGCKDKPQEPEEKKPESAPIGMVFDYLEDAKVTKTQLDCRKWESAANVYYLNNQKYPDDLKELEKYLEKPEDSRLNPWGLPYKISVSIRNDGLEQVNVITTTPDGKTINKNGFEEFPKPPKK